MKITVRPATLQDAPEYHHILREIDICRSERTFLDDELEKDATMQIADMEWYLTGENRTILVADTGKHLVGYALLLGGSYEVDYRTGMVVIEVLEPYRRKGIGERLLKSLEQFASEKGMHRLELTVLSDNEAALALYRKCGFTKDGERREARWIGGRFRDEYWMSKLIG